MVDTLHNHPARLKNDGEHEQYDKNYPDCGWKKFRELMSAHVAAHAPACEPAAGPTKESGADVSRLQHNAKVRKDIKIRFA